MAGLSGKVEWPAKKACLLSSNNSPEFSEKEKKNAGKKKWCIQTTFLTVILTFLNDTDMYASFFR